MPPAAIASVIPYPASVVGVLVRLENASEPVIAPPTDTLPWKYASLNRTALVPKSQRLCWAV